MSLLENLGYLAFPIVVGVLAGSAVVVWLGKK